jgi:hypothetical protein
MLVKCQFKLRVTGGDKQQCTVMLAITTDGHNLPPFVIFRIETLPKYKFLSVIVVRVQRRGWVTEELILE